MAHNVSPGDRAWVINCEAAATAWTVSRVVVIDSICDCEAARHRGRGGPVWVLVDPLVLLVPEGVLLVECLPDWCLKRIPPEAAPAPTKQQPLEEMA